MSSADTVAEVQGLYGPFAFPELLLQKLWWRREFAAGSARTVDGQTVVIRDTGRWNRLGGPDFRGAVVELGGVRWRGDVEVHLRAEDWDAHRHAGDAAYGDVRLHVVLFPPRNPFTVGVAGQLIPILVLLPLLWHDLEEYATDAAIAALLNRAEHRIAAELTPLPAAHLARLIQDGARQRWMEKVRFARRRIERLGWREACHQTALEILGYRANRAGMLRAAGQWPLADWEGGRVDPDGVYAALREAWAIQGVRPANHPRTRLHQYANWVRMRPDWPGRLERDAGLAGMTAGEEPLGEAVAEVRRRWGFPEAWSGLQERVCGGALGGTRADNLMSDGLLPLAAARGTIPESAAQSWWWAGYPGDLPDPLRRALRDLGWAASRERPLATGPAQGLLGWLLHRESLEARSEASRDGQGA